MTDQEGVPLIRVGTGFHNHNQFREGRKLARRLKGTIIAACYIILGLGIIAAAIMVFAGVQG